MSILSSQMGSAFIGQIAGKYFGGNSKMAQMAISAALPMLIGALARNSSKQEGANQLASALDNDHDGGILDDLTGFLGGNHQNQRAANGAGILKHLLGDKRSNVENAISQNVGVDAASTGGLLETLAPIVLGQLGREKRQNNLDANGLAQLLNQNRQEIERKQPAKQRNFIMNLLDQDGDGKIDENIKRKGLGILGSLFRRR